jgi:hypothetical protein
MRKGKLYQSSAFASYVVGTIQVWSYPAHHLPRVPSCFHAFAVMNLGEIVKMTIVSTGL